MVFPFSRFGLARALSARLAGALACTAAVCLVLSGERVVAQAFDPQSLTGLHGDAAIDPALLESVGRTEVTRAYIPDAVDLSPLMPPPLL